MTGETIQLDRAPGGGMNQVLAAELIASRLRSTRVDARDGGATVELDAARIAVAADTFMVDPILFDGGDIGRLAVCGIVNDLAVRGSVPRCLTLSLAIEQGLPVADLTHVLDSVCEVAAEVDVEVLAGDTRVLYRGEVDRLMIAAAGVGELSRPTELGSDCVRPGDAIIATGWLGNHGIHVLSRRESLECGVLSDCAPLDGLIWNVLEDYEQQVHHMCTLSRGGLGAALAEVACAAGLSIEVDEHRLPVQRETGIVARRLGVDPLHVAGEGCICMFVEDAAAAEILELIRWQPQARAAQIVGTVREDSDGTVAMVCLDGDRATVALQRRVEPPRLR